jgi:hypothetical protein
MPVEERWCESMRKKVEVKLQIDKNFRSRQVIWTVAFYFLSLLILSNLACERQTNRTVEVKTNSPPVITSALIAPEGPNIQSDLHANIQCQDADNDPVDVQYRWIRNEEEIPGENGNILKRGSFGKGDLIRVRVTPSDGKKDGNPILSSAVRISNSLPVIQKAWIEPKVAYANDRLEVYAESFDKDGDTVYHIYQGEKNGTILPEEKSATLERGGFRRGDSIVAIVTPDDREGLGLPKKTAPIIVSNGPPLIISSPSTTIEGTKYSYQVKTNDPDDEPVTFILKSHPKGMVVDQKTGLIRWEVKNGDKGDHSIEIEASDPEGAKSFQRFTLSVDIK